MKFGAKKPCLCSIIFAILLTSFVTTPVFAKRIELGEDDWIDVGHGSNGDLWSIQAMSVTRNHREKTNIFSTGGNVWIKIIAKNGGTYRKIYWTTNCDDKAHIVLSTFKFSSAGTELSHWDNPRSTALRALPTWTYAAPGTIESKVIDQFCSM